MIKKIEKAVDFLDKSKLWIVGIVIISLTFLPYILMGKGSVFDIHDQLDETILSYLLTGRYMFSGVNIYPEMMNGISASGMLPSAILFVPLYRIFDIFTAFVLQFYIVSVSAFIGMYGLIKKLTGSGGIALVIGILFALLPFKPVYGLSVVGVPLLILCFWNLHERRNIVLSMLGIVYFGLTTHLVLIGFVVLIYLAILVLYLLLKKKGMKKENIIFYLGFAVLTLTYVIVNFDLFVNLLFAHSDFVSHRVEFYHSTEGINVLRNIYNLLVYGEGTYAPSYHWYIAPVVLVVMVVYGIRYKKLQVEGKKLYKVLLGVEGLIIIHALLHGLFTSSLILDWQNKQSGVLHYFQFDRFSWIYPTLWWCAAGISFGIIWKDLLIRSKVIKIIIFLIVILPTVNLLKTELALYDNINQYNNGSQITGMPTWEEYFMEDVLQLVDEHIGRDKETYKIAHLGLSPAPSLVYGFYTIDGYSNNYPLEYKYEFRTIIEKELDKDKSLQNYFDTWGSRCHLFVADSGDYSKYSDFKFENIELDYSKMKQMGCDYILSAKEIYSDNEGLKLEGIFSTEDSQYEIWLYYIE